MQLVSIGLLTKLRSMLLAIWFLCMYLSMISSLFLLIRVQAWSSVARPPSQHVLFSQFFHYYLSQLVQLASTKFTHVHIMCSIWYYFCVFCLDEVGIISAALIDSFTLLETSLLSSSNSTDSHRGKFSSFILLALLLSPSCHTLKN